WVGLPIIVLTLALSWGLVLFERVLAVELLGADIPPLARRRPSRRGVWPAVKAHLTSVSTWKGQAFLLGRFPAGLASFVILVVLLAAVTGLLGGFGAYIFTAERPEVFGTPMNPELAVLSLVLGVAAALVTVPVLNGVAFVSRRFAELMLT